MIGNIVTILNRAPFALEAVKDGRVWPIPPGKSHLTSDVVAFAKTQNPVPGSEDPGSGAFESLISVVADDPAVQRDPLDLVPADVLKALPKERIDRSLLPPDRQQGTTMTTGFPSRRVGVDAPSPGMVDPGKFN